MKHYTIEELFYISLFGGMPLGLLLVYHWARRIFPSLMKSIDGRKYISISDISDKSLFYVIPGLLLLILCCVPVLYFNYLLKQERYCLEVIKVNKGIQKDARYCKNDAVALIWMNYSPQLPRCPTRSLRNNHKED